MARLTDYSYKPTPQYCSFTSAADTVQHVVPNPSQVVINTGIEEITVDGASRTGLQVTKRRYKSAEKPTITMTFPTATAKIVEFVLGREFAIDNVSTYYFANDVFLTNVQVPPSPDSAKLGHGVAADQAGTIASVLRDNQDVQLTRVNVASFNPATNDTFCQQVNAGMLFANNLLNETVSYQIPITLSNVLTLSETDVGEYGVRLSFLDLGNRVTIFEASSVQPILAGKTFDPSAGNIEVEFQINFAGNVGECTPYKMTYTDLAAFC